jgi:hypothetical protein
VTNTPIPPTATNTAVPPTATNTAVPPTATKTPLPPTATPTKTATPALVTNVTFPARATFYYPWFPEAWTQGGVYPYSQYQPTLGYYDTGNSATVESHIAQMESANIKVAILSWWGQAHHTNDDTAVFINAAADNTVKAAFYYEKEGNGNPTQAEITSDLTYLKNTYGASPSTAKINGRIVVFVYNADDTSCEVVDRWKAANTINAYLVMKVFSGYASCPNQPDAWHQYGPATRESDFSAAGSYSISPGFYKSGETSPRLARDETAFATAVRNMVASGANWQLVISFNEWGEGTGVESTTQFGTTYLTILANNGTVTGPTATPNPTATPTRTATATATPSGSSTSFWAVGDIMDDTTPHTGKWVNADRVGQLVDTNETVVTLGDHQYESGTLTEFNTYFDVSTWGALKDKGVLRPVVGNHEYNSGGSGYYTYFGAAAHGPNGYYTFTQGGVTFIIINTNCSKISGGCTTTGPQGQMITNAMQNNNGCTVLAGHHPAYTSSPRDDGAGARPLFQLFDSLGGDIALYGHEHSYERFVPLNGAGEPTAGGVQLMVVGTGGKRGGTFDVVEPASAVRITGVDGAIHFSVNGNNYTWQFVDIDGVVRDSGSGTCQ